jgi:hypothetical protein
MTKTQSKCTDDATRDAERPPYQPTKAEADAVVAVMAARTTSGPRLKVGAVGGKDRVQLGVDHPDQAIGAVALMRAIGTTDFDFYDGLMGQLVNSSGEATASESSTNFMLSVVKGIKPRDQVEGMLAAQMAAVHMASMTFARRLARVENIPQQDSAEKAFNKLTRTFAAQMSALKEYRSKGEQRMTVQHVHVAEGGQAIVGNVSAAAEGVGAHKKTEVQPHALGYAPSIEMPRHVQAEPEKVPLARRAGA